MKATIKLLFEVDGRERALPFVVEDATEETLDIFMQAATQALKNEILGAV